MIRGLAQLSPHMNKKNIKVSSLLSTKDKGKEIGLVYGSSILNTTFPTIHALENAQSLAMEKMLKRAEEIEAEWVVGVRFKTGRLSSGESQVFVYGTALGREDFFPLF